MEMFKDRYKIIEKYIKNKDVLDVGSCGQTEKYNLYEFLKRRTKNIIGIDIVGGSREGIIRASAEDFTIEKRFEVIVLGDIIEHLGNPLRALKNLRGLLKDDGKIIITTPNAKWITVAFKPNPTHTCWYDRDTIQYLLKLAGLEVELFTYYCGNKLNYPFYVKPFVVRQAMLIVARVS